jgi:hypothetical protein
VGVGSWLLSAALLGCTIDTPEYWQPPDPDPTETTVETPASTPTRPHPLTSADAGGESDVDAGSVPEETPDLVGGCTEGATRSCGPPNAVGTCELGIRTCQESAWSDCEGAVMPSERDCSSPADNDCDGFPDNTVDGVCRCPADTTQTCDAHPGFDLHGPCHAGERSCVVAPDKQSSDWGECTGSIGPVPEDSCAIKGDDSDCDGRPNGNCTCIEGEEVQCGPTQTVGICKKGTSTCVNGKFGDCMDAVYAKPRDCRSAADNDCDGRPDNTVDTVCTCAIGDVQLCNQHPGLDGIGVCKAGEQTCVAGANNRTSAFNVCVGANGASARNCTSTLDNDCNGIVDNTIDAVCACVIGQVTACGAHPGLDGKGICHAGQALCIAGANNATSSIGACSGSVGPLAADSCTVAADDSNCNGIVNDTCECVISASCSSPAAARCSAGACVGCTSNADCTHISGLGVCSAGSCVQCTASSAAACTAAQVCDPASNSCVAAPPPPPPPPPPVATP